MGFGSVWARLDRRFDGDIDDIDETWRYLVVWRRMWIKWLEVEAKSARCRVVGDGKASGWGSLRLIGRVWGRGEI
jgi:hypothetical protein